MNVKIFQLKLKYADFSYNEKVLDKNLDFDGLSVFPSLKFSKKSFDYYEKIALKYPNKTLVFGTILVQNGKVYDVKNDYFEYDNKKIYVSEKYSENINCDLYILAKNSYFTIKGAESLIENITTHTDFIFVNPVMMADENIYAGQSFVKNKDNELVIQLPICEEATYEVDFKNIVEEEFSSDEEQVYKVLIYALREYTENCGFKKIILGLSGGIDSALTAVLAKDALGAENVHTVMLPSMYSSEGSIKDSQALVDNTGISTEEVSITPLFNCFMENVAKENKGDLAEENLQSRLRGVLLMFKANRDGYLLLSTGNKSEVATGYGTLYGDMCGGLNLIADLTKTRVYALANWLNRNGEVIPQNIITKAPSAELRPNQKDQDSLPDYAVLDDIITMYFEDEDSVEDIYAKYDKELVDNVIKKFYHNEFKRRQSCLGIRLTENSFCANLKLPITSKDY